MLCYILEMDGVHTGENPYSSHAGVNSIYIKVDGRHTGENPYSTHWGVNFTWRWMVYIYR